MQNLSTAGRCCLDDQRIAQIFNRCFLTHEHTRLIGGADEPLYQPACGEQPAQLYFRQDFAASALHEAAHWCIAGPRRRRLVDFGYAYVPPPRSPQQQRDFFAAELRCQSLEAEFARTAGVKFVASADNLQADLQVFYAALQDRRRLTLAWLQTSAGERASRFLHALHAQRQASWSA